MLDNCSIRKYDAKEYGMAMNAKEYLLKDQWKKYVTVGTYTEVQKQLFSSQSGVSSDIVGKFTTYVVHTNAPW